jgi:hypothetical protein
LTAKGIEAISPLIPQVSRDGRHVSAALLRAHSAIAKADAEMVHAGASLE